MKNLFCMWFCIMLAASADAQYFQQLYGSTTYFSVLQSGVNTSNPQGHLMTGYTIINTGAFYLMVTQTNLDGNIASPSPFYNNIYTVYKNGKRIHSYGRKVLQPSFFPDGKACIWGDCDGQQQAVPTAFFYAVINASGTPGIIASYTFPGAIQVQATSMCYTNDSTIYACGSIIKSNGLHYPVVVCINAVTGAMKWGKEYESSIVNENWLAMDIVKDPNDTVLAITGSYTPAGLPTEGCFFRVGIKSGVKIAKLITYGTNYDPCRFNSMCISNNPIGSGPGYVMAGNAYSSLSSSDESWIIKITPDGQTIDFSNMIGYSTRTYDYCNDVIEHTNTLPPGKNNYEYYLGGHVMSGPFGNADALVFKLDSMGIPVTNGQFAYGRQDEDVAFALDYNDNGGANNKGLSVFCASRSISALPLGPNNFYLVKSYFNGVTACDYELRTPYWEYGPGILDSISFTSNSMTSGNLTISVSSMDADLICLEESIAEGSNERQTAPSQPLTALLQPALFPNPVSRDAATITILLGEAVKATSVEIELRNSLGQLYWTQMEQLTQGQSSMEIKLGNDLDPGLYHLIVRGKNSVKNFKLIVH